MTDAPDVAPDWLAGTKARLSALTLTDWLLLGAYFGAGIAVADRLGRWLSLRSALSLGLCECGSIHA